MDKHNLSIISYNVRGLNNSRKRISIYNYIKKKKVDIAFLQETYTNLESEIKWIQEWGGTGVFAHGSKHSRGVAILFIKSLEVNILSKKLDSQGRFIILKIQIDNKTFNLVNIYAPNKENDQVKFFQDLGNVILAEKITSSDNNIICGDWNLIQNNKLDKLGGVENIRHNSKKKLTELINIYNLVDVWRIKHENTKRYTWGQKTPRIH